jgi:uncharacterized membrane protein YcaP (DUF421 family)
MASWFVTSGTAVLGALLSVVGIYVALILLTRWGGLRSFSKMSSFDFAITVALGSLIASTVLTPDPPLLLAVVALAALYAVQMGVAKARERSEAVANAVDNAPLLLMAGREVLHENLRRAKVTESDVRAKLREANVLSLDHVHAVVLESTGDVSVLHGDPDADLDLSLFDGVQDAKRLQKG